MRQALMKLLKDTRGSALTEGVILLPFLIIVWGCLWYVHERYLERIQIGTIARSCAWEYANNACQGDPPPGCTITDGANISNDDFTEALGGGGTSALQEIKDNIGFIGPVLDAIFGHDITATKTGEVTRPAVLGSGTQSMTAAYAVVCNEKKRDLWDVIKDVYHDLTEW